MSTQHDPPDRVLIDAVLDGLKTGVVFLVDNEIETDDVGRLVQKTAALAQQALVQQLGEEAASRFFTKSENPWILRTSFGGWLFFYPIEELDPSMGWDGIGLPTSVYWPSAEGSYASVPWPLWVAKRNGGAIWRPTVAQTSKPRSIWERLRDR